MPPRTPFVTILQVHNEYSSGRGGEDTVLDTEAALLKSRGHRIERLLVSTRELRGAGVVRMVTAGFETVWSRRGYRQMEAVIRRHHPDIIHVHNTFPLLSPSVYWAAYAQGIPLVQTLHNFRLTCAVAKLMRNGAPCHDCLGRTGLPALMHRCYKDSLSATAALVAMQTFHRRIGTFKYKVGAYIVLTDFARRLMVEAGLPESKVFVKPNCLEDPVPSGKVSLQGRPKKVAFLGAVILAKGVDLLLEAWKELGLADWSLVIIGDGDALAALRSASSGMSNVHWKGRLSYEETQAELRACRWLVLPSRWYEGLPMAIVEAFAQAIPVIGPAHGAFPELITAGTDGFLFKPGDAASLALSLKQALVLAETEWLQMATAARKKFLNRFSASANYEQLIRVYEAASKDA